MTLVRNVPETWSDPAITHTAATIIQVQSGAIYVDVGGAAASLDDGLLLVQDPDRPLRDTFVVPANVTFRLRRASGRSAKVYYAELS